MQSREEYTQLFNLVTDEQEWHGGHKASEDKKLELRLAPPGEFLGYKTTASTPHGLKRALQDTVEAKTGDGNWYTDTNDQKQCKKFSCPEESVEKVFSPLWLNGSLHSSTFQCSRVEELQCPDKKACSSHASDSFSDTTAGTNSSHKRAAPAPAPAPVVGWPPIRSFRKNLANSSASKLASELPNKTPKEGSSLKPENFRNDLFVKINMEGVPIGRKINLNAYDSYEKLSVAIDKLFRGLLGGSVAGSGEYTLVYEDNEGDRILVGDVPWHMFVSTAKRLRVLKSSELSTTARLGSSEQDKTPLSSAV